MKYGLIGEKLGHSFSKIIHSELTDYDYELKEVAKDELNSFMRKADFKAINVTIPYKQDVIPYLYEIDETAIIGMPQGVGEPWFDSIESMLSHALFGIPAIKGVEFGGGFALADMFGSGANDSFYVDGDTVKTKTNNNGGINGGITNGMPVIFRCAVKPTPTISKTQQTVDFIKTEDTELIAGGRHDPCIVHRARVVVDSITALVLCDILSGRFGTDWLAN